MNKPAVLEQDRMYIPVIDSLRGVASLMVCLYHFVCGVNGLFDQAVVNLFEYGRYGVQMFFVISGVVIPLSMIKDNYNHKLVDYFLVKRMVRIELPYLVSILLFIVYSVVRTWIPGTKAVDITPSFTETLLHIGYLVPFVEGAKWFTPVYWTLAIEFQYYLLLSLFFPLLIKKSKWQILLLLSLLLGFLVYPNREFVFYWLPLFMMGISIALYFSQVISSVWLAILLIASSITAVISCGVVDTLFGLSTGLIILFFPRIESSTGRFLGKISYSLYLLHAIIGMASINLFLRFADSLVSKVVIILVALTITLVASFLFYKWVERPAQVLARKLAGNILHSRKRIAQVST